MKHVSPLLMLFVAVASASAQTPVPDELRSADRVYRALARQFNNGQPAPPLVISTRRGAVAEYDPNQKLILIERPALQAISQLGADSLNALSYILGHELAHYYLNHGERRSFGEFFAPLATVQKSASDTAWKARDQLYQRWEFETEADFRAGFNSYLAGYQPLKSAPRILEHIYKTYGMDPQRMTSHPPLSDRLAIVKLTQSALQELIAMWEGATQLMVLGNYHEAGRVYQHIAHSFPSREVLSNAGTAKLLEALTLRADSIQFVYPVELDTRSRMRGGMNFGDPNDDLPYWVVLVREAKEFFDQARLRDPSYVPAQVNLAIALNLLGEPELAAATAASAQRQAQSQGEAVTAAHARIVKAIVMAEAGRRAEAEAELKQARAAAPALADRNLAILAGNKSAAESADMRVRKPEFIGGVGRSQFAKMNEGEVTKVRLPRVHGAPELQVNVKQFGAGVTGVVVASDESINMVIAADSSYQGASAEGIRVGQTSADVKAKYGEPDRIMATSRGAYLIYSSARMAFSVDAAGKVTGWAIYGGD